MIEQRCRPLSSGSQESGNSLGQHARYLRLRGTTLLYRFGLLRLAMS
jgi:hypothetical protein